MHKFINKKYFFVKRFLARHRGSSAKTITKKLLKKGIPFDQILGGHIKPLYISLKKLKGAPDFKQINEILPKQYISPTSKPHPLWGVIVETRKASSIEFVVNNFIKNTGIPIQLFHGNNNLDFIMSTNIAKLVSEGKVCLTPLNVDELSSNNYNALLLSKGFWENVIGRRKILVFQTDAVSCDSSDYVVDDFISYDYIGSKWSRYRNLGIIADGGNGGLSLRDWGKTYSCLDRFPPERWCGGEDDYFAFHIELIGGKVGKGKECAKFSTQHEFLYCSFGAHKVSCLSKKHEIAFLKYCPEGKFLFEGIKPVKRNIQKINTPPRYHKNRRKEMRPFLPKHYSRVLEIGCGEGNFRTNLSQEHEYWGVEVAEPEAIIASKTLSKVLIGPYQEKADQIPNGYFDLVVCNDVIEHMVNHDKFLQSIKTKIGKDGCLVASIPNVRYLLNLFEILVKKDWEYKNNGILDRTHLRFFTRKSLFRTISDNGYVVDKFMGVNPYRNRSYLKKCLFNFAVLFFGQDVRFKQLGVRIKCADNTNKSLQQTDSCRC